MPLDVRLDSDITQNLADARETAAVINPSLIPRRRFLERCSLREAEKHDFELLCFLF
jgi:hypothetical protein